MNAKSLTRSLLVLTTCLFVFAGCQKIVNPPVKRPPVVFVDSARLITLPADSIVMHGSAKDPGSRIVAWLWSEVSGPNIAQIHDEGSPVTVISGLIEGTYVFQLMVTDSAGLTGVNSTTVTVKPGLVKGSYPLFIGGSTVRTNSHLEGNPSLGLDISDPINPPELDAAAWTYHGNFIYIRDIFKFDMSALPAGVPVKSAKLNLYTNYTPLNGDLIHANYGSANAFYIRRINTAWDPTTVTLNTQPSADTTGQVLIPHTNASFLDVTGIDVTTMVNNMISSGNYGFKLQLQNEAIYNSRVFYSASAADSTKVPRLIVTY